MRTRHTDPRRMWRCVLLVLILCLNAASDFAQVPQANTAQGGLSAADYKQAVAQAVGIQYGWREATARYNNKEIDLATYQRSAKVYGDEYRLLYSKWQAVGKGADLERDYKRQLAAVPWPGRSPKAAQGKVAQGDRAAAVAAQSQQAREELAGRRFVYIITIAIVGVFLFLFLFLLRRKPKGRGVSDIYGTARYAPQQLDIADERCLANGMFFGKSSAPGLRGSKLENFGAA